MSKKQNLTKVNEQITAYEVRLIGKDGQQVGVMSLEKAMGEAAEVGLDLVEISPNMQPPVCRIMDFGRYLFDQKKQKVAQKKKQHVTQVKEIKFRPVTEEADYQVKLRKVIAFLQRGDRVKITLRFRGREVHFRELGVKLLERVQEDTKEFSSTDRDLQMEGRQFFMLLVPLKS